MGKSGAPGRNFARNLRVRSAALYTLSYESIENHGDSPQNLAKLAFTQTKNPLLMVYFSHVLEFPNAAPFDDAQYRWPSFVGEFVLPLVRERPHLQYWFSYYGTKARFRVYTDKYDELRADLEALRGNLGLVELGGEHHLTLVGDLGHARWLASNRTDKKPEERAIRILQYLHSVCRLYIDYLVKRPDGYWELEATTDHVQNPEGVSFESLHHLFCNLTQVPTPVFECEMQGQHGIETLVTISNTAHQANVQPQVNAKHLVHF